MSEINELSSFLIPIFHVSSNKEKKKFIPILKDITNIIKIPSYFLSEEYSYNDKIQLIKNLELLFKENPHLINFFCRECQYCKYNFMESLIKLYLQTIEEEENIFNLINLCFQNILIERKSTDIIYQNLSKYYTNNSTIKLTEKYLLKHLKLLHILLQNKKINNSENERKNKNYIYFNGINSCCFFKLQEHKSIIINADNPIIKFGLFICFWIRINEEIIDEFFILNNNSEINLINLFFEEDNIKISIIKKNVINIKIFEQSSYVCKLKKDDFKYGEWNFFAVNIKINDKLYLYLNNQKIFNSNKILNTENFQISQFKFFENLIGEVSSIFFYYQSVNEDFIQSLFNLKYGFYSSQITEYFFSKFESKNKEIDITEFMKKEIKKKSLKINEKEIKSQIILDINKTNLNNIFILFTPFLYNKKKNYLDDICGIFRGYLSNIDGVNTYCDVEIGLLGGINNLLPILELMISSNKYNNVDNNILSEEVFYQFLNLIASIVIENLYNLKDCIYNNFFYSLSIFISKIPHQLFTQRIIFKCIEITFFNVHETNGLTVCEDNSFLSNIFLNEQFIIKIKEKENILKYWKDLLTLNDLYKYKIKKILVSSLCLLLRFYDQSRYNSFCCEYHSHLFKKDNFDCKNNREKNQNSLRNILDNLLKIILFYLENNIINWDELLNIFNILMLDNSPCIQILIIDLLIMYFSHDNDIKIKKKFFEFLLKNNFIEIYLFVFSIGLQDVKNKLIELLICWMGQLSKVLDTFLNEKKYDKIFYLFIIENLISENLYIEKEQEKLENNNIFKPFIFKDPKDDYINLDNNTIKRERKNKTEKLNKYFNQSIYNQQKNNMFVLLFTFFNSCLNNNTNTIKFNSHFFHLMMQLCSNYIDENNTLKFIVLIEHLYKISNEIISDLFKNFTFYCWIIQSIYIYSIKSESSENTNMLINYFFNLFLILIDFGSDELNQKKKIKYINIYLLFLKKLNLEEKKYKKIKEVTRKLYLKLLEKKDSLNDYRIIYIFEFMIIHNNLNEYENDNLDSSLFNQCIPNCIIKGVSLGNRNNNIIWEDNRLFKIILNDRIDILNLSLLMELLSIELDKINNNKYYKYAVKEGGFVQKKKNILYNKFKNLFSMKITNYELITIIEILFIGLSIEVEITDGDNLNLMVNNSKIKEFEKLIIFCILISINISSQKNDMYDSIQDLLFNILTFGLLFLKKKNEDMYNNLIKTYINEIFLNIIKMKHSHPSYSKQNYNKVEDLSKCAIVRLFDYNIINENEILKQNENINLNNNDINYNYYPENILKSDDAIQISIELLIDDKNLNYNLFNLRNYVKIINTYNEQINNFIILFYPEEKENVYKKQNESYINFKYKIEDIILQKVDFLEKEYEKLLSLNFFKDKIKRNQYKKVKKKLFSWIGSWSDKNLFYKHPENLKLKLKNHYSGELIKTILVPILDINYYFPNFSKFDKNKFFKDDNKNYYINLDIDDVLNDSKLYIENKISEENDIEKEEEIKKEEEKKEENNIENTNAYNEIFIKNDYGFNYLENIYKTTYPKLWKYYLKIIPKKIDFQLKNLENLNVKDFLENNEINSENKKKSEKIFIECCLIKATHHIRGIMTLDSQKIIFTKNLNHKYEEYKKELTYFKEKNICFGSIFKSRYSDKDIINLTIEYNNIKLILKKNYFYLNTAIEILTKNNKSYYFNFNSKTKIQEFLDKILSHLENPIEIKDIDKNIIAYDNLNKKQSPYKLKRIIDEYINYKISTLEYLMWLNLLGNRSFLDLSQYPVFPWVITNYADDEIDIKLENNLRNLDIPMGMMDISPNSNNRKEEYLETYNSMKQDFLENNPNIDYYKLLEEGNKYFQKYKKSKNQDNDNIEDFNPMDLNHTPYYYGSHYSNPTYVSLYLTRIFPFAEILIEIQGNKFDDPDRLFNSLQNTFENAISQKVDLRELTPEFFYLPEIFHNINNINFLQGYSSDNFSENVILPNWAKNKSYKVIILMRNILEKKNIKINKWIDLIFGYCQKGKKSEESNNIFQSNTYLNFIDIENIKDEDTKNALMGMAEMGMTPRKLFNEESKSKISINKYYQINIHLSESTGKFLIKGNKFVYKVIESESYNSLLFNYNNGKLFNLEQKVFPHIVKIIEVDYRTLLCVTNNNYIFNLIIGLTEQNITIKEQKPLKIKSCSTEKSLSYKISNCNCPIIINKNRDLMIKGGFYNGKIEITKIDYQNITNNIPKTENIILNNRSPITYIALSKDERNLICGCKNGTLIFYKIEQRKIKKLIQFYNHFDEIIYISICDKLDICGSVSYDGYVNIYVIEQRSLIRSIKIDNDNRIYAKFIFISNCPLPSFSIFIPLLHKFKSFTINGSFICECDEDEKIYSPKIFNTLNFNDYLIYGTDSGYIKIRKFPEMELIQNIDCKINKPIFTLEISENGRYCYVWCEGNKIYIINDESVNGVLITSKLTNLGFHLE